MNDQELYDTLCGITTAVAGAVGYIAAPMNIPTEVSASLTPVLYRQHLTELRDKHPGAVDQVEQLLDAMDNLDALRSPVLDRIYSSAAS